MPRHARLAGILAAVVGLVILYAATFGSFQSQITQMKTGGPSYRWVRVMVPVGCSIGQAATAGPAIFFYVPVIDVGFPTEGTPRSSPSNCWIGTGVQLGGPH
jgi:hypothetical protein